LLPTLGEPIDLSTCAVFLHFRTRTNELCEVLGNLVPPRLA